MTCGCGDGTVWYDHEAKKWKGHKCGMVRGQIPGKPAPMPTGTQ